MSNVLEHLLLLLCPLIASMLSTTLYVVNAEDDVKKNITIAHMALRVFTGIVLSYVARLITTDLYVMMAVAAVGSFSGPVVLNRLSDKFLGSPTKTSDKKGTKPKKKKK